MKSIVKEIEEILQNVFQNHGPFQGAPIDEYDCLIHHIISKKDDFHSISDLERFVSSDFTNHIGVGPEPAEFVFLIEETWKIIKNKEDENV